MSPKLWHRNHSYRRQNDLQANGSPHPCTARRRKRSPPPRRGSRAGASDAQDAPLPLAREPQHKKKPFITARLLLRVDTKDTFYRSTISVLTTREISTRLSERALEDPSTISKTLMRTMYHAMPRRDLFVNAQNMMKYCVARFNFWLLPRALRR